MSNEPPPLEQIQRWMQEVITHPRGIEPGINSPDARQQFDITPNEIESVICRSRNLTSIERLAVYGNAYYARLLDCMRGLFPVLSKTLGEELFDQFSFDYLQQYPSQNYTLARLADNFVRYLEESRPTSLVSGGTENPSEDGQPGWSELLIDLARLEQAIDEVFDGPGIEGGGLTPAQLEAIPAQAWPEVRLEPAPCLRLLELRFPLNVYYTAVRRDSEQPPLPEAEESFVALTRQDYVVRRYSLSRAQYEMLSRLAGGATVGQAIGQAAAHDDDWDTLEASLQNWFQHWTEAGFFSGVSAPASA